MIVSPRTPQEWASMTGFLRHHAQVQPSPDMKCLGWVTDDTNKLVIVVGLHGFMGGVAQIHLAFEPGWHFSPREMLRAVFDYAFNQTGREMLIGVVNSKNDSAMKMDLHLGFKELYRLPGMHDDGGDIVLLGMKKSECRYIAAPVPSIVIAEPETVQ